MESKSLTRLIQVILYQNVRHFELLKITEIGEEWWCKTRICTTNSESDWKMIELEIKSPAAEEEVIFDGGDKYCEIFWEEWWCKSRVAKCHGYDGYIRVKIFAGWGKKSGRAWNLAKLSQFWEDLNNLCKISVYKPA